MELRQRVRQAATAALRGKPDDPQCLNFWLCEGLKKRNVTGLRTQSLETLVREWDMEPTALLNPDVHFLNESTGIVVPRGDEIGKYIGDKDVVRLCTGDELQKLIEKFATRDPQIAAELMGPNKSHTPLGAAISKLKRMGAANPTIKMLQKTFEDSQNPHDEEAELLERFPEVDPVFETGEVIELSDEEASSASHKCDMCDVSWPDDATGKNMYRHLRLGLATHHGCTQFTADVLTRHPEITTREALVGSATNLSQLNRPGTFHVTVHRAADLPGAQLLGTKAPYAKLSLLPWKEPIQTKPAESGGRNPIWKSMHDNMLTFSHMYNSTITPIPLLEVEIWNSHYISDDLVACALLDMTPLLRYPNIEAKRWFTLSGRAQTPMSLMRDAAPSGALPRVLLSVKFVPLQGKFTTGNEHKFRVHQLKSVGLAIPSCAVCDRVIMNVLKNVWGYRCETCGIDVHKPCIMKAMTKCECKRPRSSSSNTGSGSSPPTPSGTEPLPQSTGSSSSESPTDPAAQDGERQDVYLKQRQASFKVLNHDIQFAAGHLFVRFDGLHLCTKQCNAVSNLHAKNIFEGDTYCRLTLGATVYETSPVLKSADPMYMERVCFKVQGRKAAFKIEVIDFNTDTCIAEFKTSLFQLIQQHADAFVESYPLLKTVRATLHHFDLDDHGGESDSGDGHKVAAVRDVLPTLPNEERFALVLPGEKKNGTSKKKRLGHVLLMLDYVESKRELLRVRMDDDADAATAAASSLADKEFSVESLRATIDRLGRTIKLFRWIDAEYADIIAWKNKKKSGMCLVLFVAACLWMDLEYAGAYVLLGAVVYMIYQLRLRLDGHLEKRWIDFQAYDLQQEERLLLHRPVADLFIAVHEAKLSEKMEQEIAASQVLLKDLGTRLYYYIRMTYKPNDRKRVTSRSDTLFLPSPFGETMIGWTHPVEKSQNPIWRTPSSSSAATIAPSSGGPSLALLAPPQQKQRKEFPFRNFNVSWRHNAAACGCDKCVAWRSAQEEDSFAVLQDTCGVDHHAFYFPVLQACRKNFSGRADVVPWKLFPGLLQFELCLSLTGEARETPDLVVASGVVNLKDHQSSSDSSHEIRVPLKPEGSVPNDDSNTENASDGGMHAKDAFGELVVRVELCTNDTKSRGKKRGSGSAQASTGRAQLRRMASSITSSGSSKRIPHVEREYSDFVCESLVEKEKPAVLGQTIFDAFSKVKDTIRTLQTDIDTACGTITSVENLFNWTHPWKSALVFAVLLTGVVVLSVVKGRWLVLVFGLTEFGAVFLEDLPPSNHLRKVLWKLVTSLPTDQDLIELYEGEREVYLQSKRAEKEHDEKRRLLLRYHALWVGVVMSKGESDRSYKSWFMVYRPYRFVLWKTQDDAEAGSPPHIQLLFERMESIIHSHKIDEKSFIFHVFGTTNTGADEKRSFSFESEDKKEDLLHIVRQSSELPRSSS